MCACTQHRKVHLGPSMKVPPKRKGNNTPSPSPASGVSPSMKVPPKRKGNTEEEEKPSKGKVTLNESPSEKEGKFLRTPSLTLA